MAEFNSISAVISVGEKPHPGFLNLVVPAYFQWLGEIILVGDKPQTMNGAPEHYTPKIKYIAHAGDLASGQQAGFEAATKDYLLFQGASHFVPMLCIYSMYLQLSDMGKVAICPEYVIDWSETGWSVKDTHDTKVMMIKREAAGKQVEPAFLADSVCYCF